MSHVWHAVTPSFHPLIQPGQQDQCRNVKLKIPPITTVASGRWTSAPALVASAIGTKPKAATKKSYSSEIAVPLFHT